VSESSHLHIIPDFTLGVKNVLGVKNRIVLHMHACAFNPARAEMG
jgi:hypothetical protein